MFRRALFLFFAGSPASRDYKPGHESVSFEKPDSWNVPSQSGSAETYLLCAGARRRSSLSTLSSTCRIVSGLGSSAGNSASTRLPSGATS